MTEEKVTSKPRQLWDNALRAVKGDNTMKLVEQFTAEMTLVAEGVVEDQSRLHGELDQLQKSREKDVQRLDAAMEALESSIRENQRDTDQKLNELGKQLDALQSQLKSRETRKEKDKKQTLIMQLTILVSIVCGSWVLVTILNLFK